MRRRTGRTVLGLGLFAAVAATVSCEKKTGDATPVGPVGGKPVIYTTFYPTKYFAERIGGDAVEVVCPVPADEDAIFWMPDAQAIAEYQKADLIVLNGAEFAKWVAKVSLPQAKVVDTAKPFENRFVKFEKSTTHSHGPAGLHEHKGIDGHTWVDPVNAKIQAGEILKAMKKRFPEHSAAFDKNWKGLAADLDGLDKALSELTKQLGDRPLLASHPAYNYVRSRYKWKIASLDLDPEEMPSDQTFAQIKALLGRLPAKLILWEAYPKEEIAKRFGSDLGLVSVEFSPCELLGDVEIEAGSDYLKVMKTNIENVRKALE